MWNYCCTVIGLVTWSVEHGAVAWIPLIFETSDKSVIIESTCLRRRYRVHSSCGTPPPLKPHRLDIDDRQLITSHHHGQRYEVHADESR